MSSSIWNWFWRAKLSLFTFLIRILNTTKHVLTFVYPYRKSFSRAQNQRQWLVFKFKKIFFWVYSEIKSKFKLKRFILKMLLEQDNHPDPPKMPSFDSEPYCYLLSDEINKPAPLFGHRQSQMPWHWVLSVGMCWLFGLNVKSCFSLCGHLWTEIRDGNWRNWGRRRCRHWLHEWN